jgi:hypothetical protein
MQKVEVVWHVGFGLGHAKAMTSSDRGRAHIYAPRGHLLAVEAKGHDCLSDLLIEEAKEGRTLTLICR